MYNISDKLVCVDDSPIRNNKTGNKRAPLGHVKKGTIYVVETVFPTEDDPFFSIGIVGKPIIWLPTGEFCGWSPLRFRKLEEIQEENREKKLVYIPCAR